MMAICSQNSNHRDILEQIETEKIFQENICHHQEVHIT